MKLTVLIFNAFNQTYTKVFCKGESFEQIADILSSICETFDALAVWHSEEADILSCNIINQHKKQTINA